MSAQDVIYGLIVGLAVGTAIGIVLADVFWSAARWRNLTKSAYRTARQQTLRRWHAEQRCELYRQLWLEAISADAPPAGYDGYSRKAKALSLVEKAGV